MGDISVKILRPVAVPQKFLGAPLGPAALNVTVGCLTMIVCFIFRGLMLVGITAMLSLICVHVFLIYDGTREPHRTNLLRTATLTLTTARKVGGRRTKYFPAA